MLFQRTKSYDLRGEQEVEKMLKKMPVKELSINNYKMLQEHIESCAETSESILKTVKYIGFIIGMMALEKINEMFHLVQHFPNIGG